MSDEIYKKGDLCGPYRIDSFLEAGGFAEVYAGTNTLTGRRAALKVLQSDRGRIEEVLDRFKREIQLLATLEHDNVVGFYEAGVDGARIWAAMELLEGRTLRVHLHERGALDVEEALGVLYEIACGVAAAQEVGVVHRDIKPENVFLVRSGMAKVLDFGIAKFVGWGFESTGRGQRHVLGTPSYLTPEQIQGDTPTFASDVYQAGLVGYEMLSGQHLWSYHNGESPTQGQICDLQIHAAPRRLKGLRDDVWALLEKALRKSPEERYADMDELAAATWEVLETIRIERSGPDQHEDRRNPPASDGTSLGPLARRAFVPAHTPAHDTPPPLPTRKVELRLVKNEGRSATLPPPPAPTAELRPAKKGEPGAPGRPTPSLKTVPMATTAPARAPAVHTTLPLDRDVGVPEPTAQQWTGAAPRERTTAPMPASGAPRSDYTPAWVPQARPAAEGPDFLDYIVPPGVPPHAPVSSMTPTLASVPARPEAGGEEGEALLRGAPAWLVVMMITSAVASVIIAGYYLLGGRSDRREASAAVTAAPSATETVAPIATVTATPAATAASAATVEPAVTAAPKPAESAPPARVAPVPAPRALPASFKPTPRPAATSAASAPPAVTASAAPRAPHRIMDVED